MVANTLAGAANVVANGPTYNIALPAGNVLTLDLETITLGTLTQLGDIVGQEPHSPIAINGNSGSITDPTYGPFQLPRRYAIALTRGSLRYSIAPFDPETQLSGAQTAAIAATAAAASSAVTNQSGTFDLNGATPVTVANAYYNVGDVIAITLNTVGGTVGAHPVVLTVTDGVGFTVAGTALDVSTYSYKILKGVV